MARKAKYGPYNYERKFAGRDYNLAATVDEFASESEARLRDIARNSIIDLINDVQTPVAKGGKMRVDTGFLRASGQIGTSGMPFGDDTGDSKKKYPQKNFATARLAGFIIGETIYFGWTAKYARVREAYDGFLISGIQKWQQIVNARIAQRKARIEKQRAGE